MSRDCRRVEELLGRFLDGELDEQQAEWVGRHLDGCPECRHKLVELEAVDRLFKEKDEPPRLADEYWDWHRNQVWRAIRSDRRRRWEGAQTLRFNWMRAASVAAGAAVVLLAAIGGWRVLQRYGAAPLTVGEETVRQETGRHAVPPAGSDERQPAATIATPLEPEEAIDPVRAESRSEKPAAGLALEAEEFEVEAMADADGAGLTDEGGEAASGKLKTGSGTAAGRGLESSDVSSAVASRKAPAAAKLAGAAGKDRDTAPPTMAEACDVGPAVTEIGILPRVALDETATVFLRALVEPDGSVSQVEFEQSSGIGLLDSIAARNVRQARFRAGVRGDETVRCWVRVAQQFEAEDQAETVPEPDSE